MLSNILFFFKNHIAILISLVSLVISLYNFFYTKYSQRKRISIEFISYRIVKLKDVYIYQIKMSFTNISHLPISITNISMNNNIFCAYGSHLIKVEKIPLISNESRIEETKTIQFPINLSQLEGKNGYLEFKTSEQFDIKDIILNIYTNRGKIENITPIIQNIKKDIDTPYCL